MSIRLEVIKWEDTSGGRQIVQRMPPQGMADLKLGARCIVGPSQAAVFFRDGKALDVFKEGTHTLTTMNVPLLSKLFSFAYQDAPFQAAVYYVSLKPFRDMGWGTKEPITLQDAIFGLVRVRSFGKFSVKVTDPMMFIGTVVGTEGRTDAEDIEGWFKTVILDAYSDIVANIMRGKSVVEIQNRHADMTAAMKARTSEDFAKYGIELHDFKIESISLPEAVQKKIDERSGMGALMAGGLGMNTYMQYQAAEAMSKAAASGNAGNVMGAGLGMGLGMMMPGAMAPAYQAMYGQPGQPMMMGGQPGMYGQPGMQQPGMGGGPPPPLPGAFQVSAPYYAALNGQQAGPFDGGALKGHAQSGQLKPDTLVWKNGMAAWTKAAEVGELAALFAPAGPPPLPGGPPPVPAGPPPLNG
ncbi:MAG: SPFH domain-containing protein [Planctomycetota bacterium]